MNIELKDHQKEIISRLRNDWKKYRTHLVSAPTGAGKTVIAAFIINGFIKSGMRVVFTAPYTSIVEQTDQRFQQYGLPESSIMWQNHPQYDKYNQVQICSIDTLIRREFPCDIDLLVIDECHLKRRKILEVIKSADFKVIGLSATPYCDWLGTYYDNFIKTTSLKKLIEDGQLSDYEVYAPYCPDLKGVKTTRLADFGDDYIESEIARIMGDAKIVGNIVENWIQHGENRPTIAFCCNVDHANYVTMEFNRLGVKAEVMVADTPKQERDQIVERFENGITKIICNVGVLVAGFDSDVRCIIYARPTKSEIRWQQTLGRGLRTAEGKDKCLIFDHSGTVHRLGFPCDIDYCSLKSKTDGMDATEKKRVEKEKKEKLPKECPKCKFLKDAGIYVCPKCGFKPISGSDIEVDESRGLVSLNGGKKYSNVEKQKFYSELKFYQGKRAREGKPLSDGWVSNTYKAKFGVWPKNMDGYVMPTSIDTENFIKYQFIKYAKSKKPHKNNEKLKKQALDGLNGLFNDN